MFQTKQQDKNLRRRTKWIGYRQSTQERVQGNDHKDGQRTQENGYTEQEVRSFEKRENLKHNQTEMKNT